MNTYTTGASANIFRALNAMVADQSDIGILEIDPEDILTVTMACDDLFIALYQVHQVIVDHQCNDECWLNNLIQEAITKLYSGDGDWIEPYLAEDVA